jgi:hypothetical protein
VLTPDDLGVCRYNSSNGTHTGYFCGRLQVSGSWNECHGSTTRDQPCCGVCGQPLEGQSKNDKLIGGDSPSNYLLLENVYLVIVTVSAKAFGFQLIGNSSYYLANVHKFSTIYGNDDTLILSFTVLTNAGWNNICEW